MKLVRNTGTDRVIDLLRPGLTAGRQLDVVTPDFSLFAFSEMMHELAALAGCRLLLPPDNTELAVLGSDADRAARNRLTTRWLARRLSQWIGDKTEVRRAHGAVPQGAFVLRDGEALPLQVLLGSLAFSTDGLGLTPGNPLNLIQASETPEEANLLSQWFDVQWSSLVADSAAKAALIGDLQSLATHRDPFLVYTLILHHIFRDRGDDLDEERIIKSATGIRNTVVWKKLYRFQRDGVVGAIDKLDRFGGCIIADSVGLGKTFEALAIIKYHELRNDRVLVLVPKRLRDNWTLYKANDRRNVLASDRFNYDVLNHTDLSRNGGSSGDIDLAHVNWGNYDLVVIDESHNFRNKQTPQKGGETRYDRLMRKIIKEGVKTRVLMLSATPVNNRLADLRNQIAFATEGDDTALLDHGIGSIDSTTRLAQKQFNRWLDLDDAERNPTRLIEMLGFDYFTLLDLLTIARSRKHIEKYYGTAETGRFPDRLKPINIKADVDRAGEFRSIREINNEIRRLNLASYAPLRYVLPHKQEAYDKKYSTEIKGGTGFFRQVDREESLIHLLRVNVLKRMESAVPSFALTVQRQLRDVEATLTRIESQAEELEEIEIEDVDLDDPAFESLLVGRKVKVLLKDVDLIRWKQDLIEDRNRLATLHAAAAQVDASRDAKLTALREVIEHKCRNPINPGNRKVIVFTAFADTARYLYDQLAPWAKTTLGIDTALVTGTGRNQTTLHGLRKDLASILTTFAPRAKERPDELAGEGELDILIATDCISEGQNLQDCDWLINYDIHWNPVRIIQRFGRIDRIASPNERIQLVNFWPNMELEEYINLEQRVSGRMVLLDISATGEENLIEQQSGNQMNDLEYRRKQLLKLQDAVIDLEDLSTGVSIADLTFTDFRIDLAQYLKAHPGVLESLPLGTCAVTTTAEAEIAPGIIFCLRAEGDAAKRSAEAGYPLGAQYLVHVGDDGTVLLPYTQAKQILDRLKRLCLGRDLPDAGACARFDKATKQGEDMRATQRLLAAAVASVVGKNDRRLHGRRQHGTRHRPAGKDFVYPDNFQDNIKNYLELTGQTGEGGRKLSSNTEASGRFHTDWLNMMYPRLKLARNVLRDDGAIFISSDDGEVANLRAILNDIFGAENFVAQFVWKARQFTDARAATNVSTDHEYILAYARDAGFAVRGVGRDESKFTNPDEDPRGPWMSRSMLGLATRDQRPNLHYDIVEPVTGRRFPPNPSTGWRYSPDKMQRLIEEKAILFPPKDDGRPREKKFRKDMMADFIAFRSIIDGVHTANGTEEIRTIFGAEVFNFPKPTELLRQLVEQVADTGDIVMDFFAGSATTAHAVWLQNNSDNDFRRWILVQLPEPLDPANKDQKVAVDFCDKLRKPRNIAELTKERLRRAGKKIREENPMFAGDLGFRVFKLDSSNIQAWDPDRDNLAASLEANAKNLKVDRTEQDILFELLLKLGLDLTVPMEKKKMEGSMKKGHEVHSIGGGVLLVCLSESIVREDVEPLAMGIIAWHAEQAPAGESAVVFRDSAFADDVAKTNLAAILQQHGLQNVRSL